MIRMTGLTLIFAICTAVAAESQRSIPARFQGEWDSNLQQCGTGLNDSRLRISAHRIRLHESAGRVRAVVTQGDLDLALIAELSGEGQSWLSLSHYRLSANHASLIDVRDGNPGLVRYSCPKSTK